MMITRRPSPFGELVSLRQAMDRLFEDSFVRPGGWTADGNGGVLPLDIYRTADALVVKAALPGVKPEDVQVTVEGDSLTIAGEFRDEHSEDERGYVFRELRRGSFSRTVQLPNDIAADHAQAHYDNGVLSLTLPRREEARPRQIRITPTTDADIDAGSPDTQPAGKR